MKTAARWLILLLFTAGFAGRCPAEDWLERLQQALTVNAFDGNARERFSGTLDLEAWQFAQPPPGLIESGGHFLFNPRLTLFADAQLGVQVYGFAQARVDRGFDPSDGGARVRLDEYALRWTPWSDARLNLQLGKFGTVVGNWMQRHGSWENPFITAPLPYENLTGLWDTFGVGSAGELLAWGHVNAMDRPADILSDKYLRLPIIWGPSYTTGVAAFGRTGPLEYAAELKNASLSSRPAAWELNAVDFAHPTYSGRLGWRPNEMWKLGISASTGAYLLAAAEELPAGRGSGDYREWVLGQDLAFAWHHFQFWAEAYEARFEIPVVGHADTLAYYLEAKYKLTPQLYAALRWNQQVFGDIRDDAGQSTAWGRATCRVDLAVGYRLTEFTQLKIEYDLQREHPAETTYTHRVAGQLTIKF